MSKKYFTHATPTLFNAGTPKPQMSSCFLLTMQDDSIDGIYDTLKQTAKISQSAGGIGLSIHNIRATGSYIAGTNGTSNGIIKFKVPQDAPDQLYYNCQFHSSMNGIINIVDNNSSGVIVTDTSSNSNTGGGYGYGYDLILTDNTIETPPISYDI